MPSITMLDTLGRDMIRRAVSRREALRRTGTLAGTIAIASAPVALGPLAKRALAQGGLSQEIIDVLNFALTLEYLESEFYRTGLGTAALIPAADRPVFVRISRNESAHVALLQSVLGANAVAQPTFDLTAGGRFPDVFSNYATFLALAQGFEDNGVRAYKGQAPNLMSNDQILTTALRIHSVEARQASEVRRLRGQKGWITGNQTDVPALAPIYAGEEAANGQFSSAAAAEAFDEPLTREEVLAIVDPFIV